MKKAVLLALLLPLAFLGFGQQVEYSVWLNSGLFRFGGASATENSALILGSGLSNINYTENPYGKNPGWSYGVAGQVQKVTPKNLVFGLQGGYEILRSKVDLKNAYTMVSSFLAPTATGQTIFTHYFINAHPFIGKRLNVKQLALDLSAGPDLAYALKSHEKGNATYSSGQVFTSDKDRDKPGLDTRARIGLTAYYHHVGIMLGYSYGLKNYTPTVEGANLKNYARLFRFGLAYKI